MNPAADILSALLAEPTQNERLLRLHTPLGADVLLAERLDGTESIEPSPSAPAGLRFTLHALSTSVHLDFRQIIGQPVLIELELADASLRPWHGHVTAVAMEGSDGGLARYRLTIEPWLAFLGHRQDSWVFQDKTVPEIVDSVFAEYAGQGKLVPAWRWDLSDAGGYPRRSLCIQYQESDLAFVQRLLREEGLFGWFEHHAAPGDDHLGSHTLVIADHNGAFAESIQPTVRFAQAGASFAEDSLVRWERTLRVQAARLSLASPDYRSGPQQATLRHVEAAGSGAPVPALAVADVPGQYAYPDSVQGARLARRQMEALDAQRERVQGGGTWRGAAPGRTFSLIDHPVHDGSDAARDRFVVLTVRHRARNNLRIDPKACYATLPEAMARDRQDRSTALPNAGEEPLFDASVTAQRAAVPVRTVVLDDDGVPDPRMAQRPTVHGVQTAVVVGLDQPVHTDRDHRVKIQFHWQRGVQSSHRLGSTTLQGECNAPASDASGSWVRVAESVAGANWGGHFVPRVGQEVLVGFLGGDIDRPVVLGAVYNGCGQPDAQGNQVVGGAAGTSGDAPAWFPGDRAEGPWQAHQHPAVLTGHKSQELCGSSSGSGGYNQLVLDDSPGQGRIELSSTSAQTRLQLGHLIHQIDNRRLHPRGHGLDLATQAWGAVRAGAGLLISAHGRPSSVAGAHQMDTREPRQQLRQATELAHTLAESAQKHNAGLPSEADTLGAAAADKSRQLPFEQALHASVSSLEGSDSCGDGRQGGSVGREAGSGSSEIGGGAGTIATLARPDLVVAAPAGIATSTPAHTVASAGGTASVIAGQDLQHLAQHHNASAVKDGLVFYTHGKAQNASKPNAETGIQLHAATGNLNTQSQTGATRLTASQAVHVASTCGRVQVTAPGHILLTAAGAAIRIEGGNITLGGPGTVELKAAAKELGGARSASASLVLARPGQMFDEQFVIKDQDSGDALAYFKYRIEGPDGQVLARGITGPDGRTQRVFTAGAQDLRLLADD